MELLVIFLLVAAMFILPALFSNNEKTDSNHPTKLTTFKKKCPPHQWFWQEIVDQDGVRQGERIVCKVCGPLRSSEE